MIRATSLTHNHDAPRDTVTLAYDDRHRRRMAMTGDQGTAFLLDLPEPTELHHGDRLLLDTGESIEVRAAPEALMEARPNDPTRLPRIAWHVGNRHLPCQILADRLILRRDHVIADMLRQLDCTVTEITAPFTPEGGAYGHGRTHSHAH